MNKTDHSPDEFLASFPDELREDMMALDVMISEIFQGHTRALWEGTFWGGTEQHIIGYGDLAQERRGGSIVHWFMVGLARQKHSFSIYVNAIEDGDYAVRKRAEKLGKVKTGAAAITFTNLTDVNLDALRDLLEFANLQLSRN